MSAGVDNAAAGDRNNNACPTNELESDQCNRVESFFSSSSLTPDTPSSSSSSISLMQPFVNFEEILLKEKVGHGSYGVVYKAVWNEQFVAVKEFEASAEQKAIETEVKQLSRVRHHNIIALFGISADQHSKYLIMEFAEGGSLHNFLHGKVKPNYSTAHAISWARQCAEGVAYLHAMKPKPLIHRDLKPLNLLLTNKGRHLKICDFGTVADKSTWMTNNKGSAAWMAPEVFEGSKYTEKCDIFSWAIVLWEVLSRQQPFRDIDNTYSIMWKIHKGERPPLIKDCPEPIEKLMTSCWADVPDLRPSMQYVVSVMNDLSILFPGAENPLEYEFVNQQIIPANSDDCITGYTLDFSSYHSSLYSNTSSQRTPTNKSNTSTVSSLTPTNSAYFSGNEHLHAHTNIPTITSARWDVIPEESDTKNFNASAACQDDASNVFNLSPSAAAARRYETIRNGMSQYANVPMDPLSVNVDANAWDLPNAKSDGRERLTVTNAKSMISNSKSDTNSNTGNIIDRSSSAEDSALDEDDNDGTEQSFHELLGPELQPEQPISDNEESQKIYREHQRLAKEYLRVDTSLYYAQDFKVKMLEQMNPTERVEKEEILSKMSDKEGLLEFYNNLRQQLENLRTGSDSAEVELPNANVVTSTTTMTTNTPVPTQQQHPAITHRRMSQESISSASNEIADDGWVVVAPNSST